MNNAKTISISEIRRRLGHFVDQVARSKKSFVITKFGKPQALLIPIPKPGHEFKTWLDQFSEKYEDTIKELAKGRHQIISDEEAERLFSKVDKRYKKTFEVLAKL